MLTRADLWLLVIGVLIVGLIVTLYFFPGYLADRKRWAEQVEPNNSDREMLGALARRAGVTRGGAR